MKRWLRVFVVVIAASACGGGDSSSDDILVESDVLVESDNGLATLSLPAGILPEGVSSDDVQLEVLVDETGEPGAPVVAVQLLPDGLVLAEPATLTVVLPEALEGGFMAIHMSGDTVEFLGGDIQQDDGVFSFSTPIGHFSLVGFYDGTALFDSSLAVNPAQVSVEQEQSAVATLTAKAGPISIWLRFGSDPDGMWRRLTFSGPEAISFPIYKGFVSWTAKDDWDPRSQELDLAETSSGWESSVVSVCKIPNETNPNSYILPTFTATLLELGEPTKADFVTFSQILGAEPAITLPDEDETRLSLLALSPGDTFRGVTAIAARVHSVCTDAADSGSATGDEDPTDEDPTEAEPEDSETESGPSLLDFLPDNSRVQLGFLTHEYSPPIAPYTAGFDIEFNAETCRIKMTQQPSNQETEGPCDPTTFVYVTTDGNVEVYVGVVCPRPDGSFFMGGFTFGGAESIAETFQSLMDSIPGLDVSLDPPQSISVDSASAPNCDEFISNPSELGYWMRTNLGPPGPIPGAQWDLAFATTP